MLRDDHDYYVDLLKDDPQYRDRVGPFVENAGDATIADAYFAPVCMRIRTYGEPLPADLRAYVDRVAALPGVKAWIDEALAEHDFLDFEEPYRLGR